MSANDSASPFGTYAPAGIPSLFIGLSRRMSNKWFSEKLAFMLRRPLILYNGRKPLDVKTFGLELRLYGFDNVAEKRLLYTPQYFDPREREMLRLSLTDNYVFVDIGSNAGGYALYVAAETSPGARIVAIDPQLEMMERLRFNVEHNGLGNITLLPVALGSHEGEIDLYVNRSNRGQSSTARRPSKRAAPVRVPVTTLLAVIDRLALNHIDALKIDAEGAEDTILVPFFENAPHSLWPRLVIVENAAGGWKTDLFGVLESKGYEAAESTRLNRIFRLSRACVSVPA